MQNYSIEQKEAAIKLFYQIKKVIPTCKKLGYPSASVLRLWIKQYENNGGHVDVTYRYNSSYTNTKAHPRVPSADFKFKIIQRCFEQGEDVYNVALEIGYSRQVIYKWLRKYQESGIAGLTDHSKSLKRGKLMSKTNKTKAKPEYDEKDKKIEELTKKLEELQFKVDVMEGALNLIKKDLGVDSVKLTNKEKFDIIGSLKEKYKITRLISYLEIARSSYYYLARNTKKNEASFISVGKNRI